MNREYTTEDGYTLTVYPTMYVDWGMTITKDEKEVFSSPCALGNETYGWKANPAKFDDYEEACDAQAEGDNEAIIEWSEEEWKECLEEEADTFIEAFVGLDDTDYPHGGE